MTGTPEPSRSRRRRGSRVIRIGLAAALLLTASTSVLFAPGVGFEHGLSPRPPSASVPPSFDLLTEVYGDGAAVAEGRLRAGLANGVTLHPGLSRAEAALARTGLPFVYYSIPEVAGVAACYPQSADPDAAGTLAGIGVTAGSDAWRLGMPEFDQGGGCWARGRPSAAGRTSEEAYESWLDFYLGARGLAADLQTPAADRGHRWMSVCVYAFCSQYAFDLGSDAVLLERNIDEVSGMSPGLAMIRGAASQNAGRQWGIDVSSYRYWTGGPTTFDTQGQLLSGWSPSTFERILYAAFMGGADIVLNEAAQYESGPGPVGSAVLGAPGVVLNPLGETLRSFADFSLRRHPGRGTPHVPIAVVQDHASGFEPRFGEFDQESATWYRQIPYTPGDTMFSGILDLAYPGHDTWGTIVPGAPWERRGALGNLDVPASQAAYRQALADGGDPRVWEPMGSTRWGESLDVLTDRADLSTLEQYDVVVLATGGPLSSALLADLDGYVRAGGTLVVNARQLPPGSEGLSGVRIGDVIGQADQVMWSDGTVVVEAPFDYQVADPSDADVVARTVTGDPVITRHEVGRGRVYTTMPDYLLDQNGAVLASGRRLLDALHAEVAAAEVDGPPLQYLVNRDGGTTIVTMINTDETGTRWNGQVRFRSTAGASSVREWTQNVAVPGRSEAGWVVVDVSVPAYGVRVFALEDAPTDRPAE